MTFWKKKLEKKKKNQVLPGARGWEEGTDQKEKVTLGNEGNVLYVDYCGGYTTVCICQNL